uniref:site-specific DNA-methyltransferase (cytosine-N(4)-specific) n=1 Tax=viral metagenome TaxID=1070528 RepID=A0A6C0LBJ2_9ZZZZ
MTKTKKIETKTYKKHAKIKMNPHRYTRKQKRSITSQLFSVSKDDIIQDYKKLKQIGCDKKKAFSKTGNNFVNYFTLEERLQTVGNKGVSFYDVWKNRMTLTKEYPYVQKVLDYYEKSYSTYPTIKVWKRIFDLYYGSISIFRPLQAMEIYCRFQPTSILDFTMGWGGRLVGACALGINSYIGIDNNIQLKKPYENMVKMLAPLSQTKVKLYFKDAVNFDYSKLKYDMVLTSPPYYNTEIYRNTTPMSNEVWNATFYEPLFKKTYQNLQKGGVYCLNLSSEIYETAAKKILGACKTKIPMKKFKRTTGTQKEEYIYIWHKK